MRFNPKKNQKIKDMTKNLFKNLKVNRVKTNLKSQKNLKIKRVIQSKKMKIFKLEIITNSQHGL